MWIPWWRLCCRTRAATYVGPDGAHRDVTAAAPLPPQPASHVRLVLVSDTHGKMDLADVPPGDVLAHCGDVLARNGKASCASATSLLRGFHRQLQALPHPHKVFIGGNHDAVLEMLGAERVRALMPGVTYLEHSGATVAGLRLWGFPYSPPSASANSAFQERDPAKLAAAAAAVPTDTHVLLSHCAMGTSSIARMMTRVGPNLRLHVMGHFHDRHGVWRGDAGELTVNAATCDNVYRPVHGAVVVDVPVDA